MTRILIVGDSEAGAIAPYLPEVTESYEQTHVDYKVGSRIEYWTGGAFAASLAEYPAPDVVVVFLGTNNYYDTTPPNIAPIFATSPAPIVWVGPTSVQGKSWPVNAMLKQAVEAAGGQYIDTESLGIPLADGIHPTPAGARQWLASVWPVVDSVTTIQPVSLAKMFLIAAGGVAAGMAGVLVYEEMRRPRRRAA